MLAWILAGLEGANHDRAATLALSHDSQEFRTGDLDHVGRIYLQAVSNEQITADQAAQLPATPSRWAAAAGGRVRGPGVAGG
jgi:putative hydrolase of HD superfamily